jgi:hypothetical protein
MRDALSRASVSGDEYGAHRAPFASRRLRVSLAGFLLLVALVAACNSSDDDTATVRPLDEILDGSIEITDL